MRPRLALAGVFGAAALAAAAPASAQFAAFSRCRAAFPCNQPFHLEYRPDSLLEGAWGDTNSAVTAHIELKKNPRIELDKPPEPRADDPVEASVRYFLRRHPAPKPPLKPAASPDPPPPAPPPADPKKD